MSAATNFVCDWCAEIITPLDDAIQLPLAGDPNKDYLCMHIECWHRQIIGSLAHVQERCGCYVPGATERDPEELSRRDAARAAIRAFEWKELRRRRLSGAGHACEPLHAWDEQHDEDDEHHDP